MMTTNLTLYRLLVKFGADVSDAEAATTIDTSALATKSDLMELRLATKADLAELKAGLSRLLVILLVAMTGIFAGINALFKFAG